MFKRLDKIFTGVFPVLSIPLCVVEIVLLL